MMTLDHPVPGQECQQMHTKLLRIGLLESESREYWRQYSPEAARNSAEQDRQAFEQRWFGSRSQERVRYLLQTLRSRFDGFPGALAALQAWNPLELDDRRIICHWHLQLSDPLYRQFSGQHLPERFLHPSPTIDRNAVIRWVDQQLEGRWAAATVLRMVAGLMGCLNEVGFCQGNANLRPLRRPPVSDIALSYGLYLLRQTNFQGSLDKNPYLASLGLTGVDFDYRLSRVPGLSFQKQLHLRDLHWHYPDLSHWQGYQ